MPTAARAHTTIVAPAASNYPYQRWVDEAKVPTPDVTLTVIEEACEGPTDSSSACTIPGTFIIWQAPVVRAREVFLHELGHNVDYYVLPQWMRERFQLLVHEERPWTAEPNGSKEYFASAYAKCAILGPKWDRDPGLSLNARSGGAPASLFRRVCRMLDRLPA